MDSNSTVTATLLLKRLPSFLEDAYNVTVVVWLTHLSLMKLFREHVISIGDLQL